MEWLKFTDKKPTEFQLILVSDGKEVHSVVYGEWENVWVKRKYKSVFKPILSAPHHVEGGDFVGCWLEDGINTKTYPYWAKMPNPPAV